MKRKQIATDGTNITTICFTWVRLNWQLKRKFHVIFHNAQHKMWMAKNHFATNLPSPLLTSSFRHSSAGRFRWFSSRSDSKNRKKKMHRKKIAEKCVLPLLLFFIGSSSLSQSNVVFILLSALNFSLFIFSWRMHTHQICLIRFLRFSLCSALSLLSH